MYKLLFDEKVIPAWSVMRVWRRIVHSRLHKQGADYLASIHPGESFVEVDPVSFDSKLTGFVEE